ncbi:MAG: hypothetical protein GY774_13210 [Planctomycetes bacterium]|nr:hypothetical protein [Planctomycetota bacterium]
MMVEYTTVSYGPVSGVQARHQHKRYRWRWWGKTCMTITNIMPICWTLSGFVFKSGKEINNGRY